MRRLSYLAAATILAAPVVFAGPSEAATAYQHWAQGRGAYVSSIDRGSTWQDDLAGLGWAPPPPPPPRRYWRRPEPQPDYWPD